MIKLEEVDVGDLEEGRVYVADEAEEKDYFLAPNPHAHIEDVLREEMRARLGWRHGWRNKPW